MKENPERSRSWRTLTEWELLAISGPYNIADGHARGWITSTHHDLVETLAPIYQGSVYTDQGVVERGFSESFFKLANQSTALNMETPIFAYSSSVCIDLVGALLATFERRRVGMITPTFDNICQLLRRRGLELVPVSEQQIFQESDDESLLEGLDALMLVTPNNPTGSELSEQRFHSIAARCEAKGIPLIVDVSFRFFSCMNDWDQYEVLSTYPGLEWVTIEDTGKVWGLSELKVGFSMTSLGLRKPLLSIHNELRLNVSPFILKVLQSLMTPDALNSTGHLGQLGSAISQNRRILSRMVSGLPYLQMVSVCEKSSVEWLRLECASCNADDICEGLLKAGVVILPGGPFFWDDPSRGQNYLRIALLRDVRYFNAAVRLLSAGLEDIFKYQGHVHNP